MNEETNDETTFKNLVGVLEYLKAQGYKASKSSVYLHANHGKIHTRKDGLFYLRDVQKYAKIFLKRHGVASNRGGRGLDSLQKERLAAETIKMKAQAEHWTVKTKALTGAFVPRDLFESELAKRAAVLKNDFDSFARSEAPAIVSIVDGAPEKTPDLIQFLLDRLEDFLDRYAEEPTLRVPLVQATLKTDDEINAEDDEEETDQEGDATDDF